MPYESGNLRGDDLLLLITYSCDLENAGMDDSAVG